MRAAQKKQEGMVPLWLSLSIETDYRGLGAFPGLRIEAAAKRSGTRLLYNVTADFAREVLQHGRGRMTELGPGRGVYQGYRAMVVKLQAALNEIDGVMKDPGEKQWQEDQAAHFARLQPGEDVLNSAGEPVTVRRGYSIRRVEIEDGEYLDDEDGKRFSYRWGYTILEGGKELFISPGYLFDRQGGITHLRLVRSA